MEVIFINNTLECVLEYSDKKINSVIFCDFLKALFLQKGASSRADHPDSVKQHKNNVKVKLVSAYKIINVGGHVAGPSKMGVNM